jgi:DNA-binding winged helix-turn-helix (wHTH) protein/TolB-like protein
MKNPASLESCIRFGVFEFNPRTFELRKQGLKIKLPLQSAKMLALLLNHAGEVRTRKELQQLLWPNDTFIDFARSLNKTVSKLRQALGDSARNPRFIETRTREGYRFIPIEQRLFPLRSQTIRKVESLAVLPFGGESTDRDIEVLKKEIVERIIDLVCQTPGLRVLAFSTIKHYYDKCFDPRNLGRDLRVHAFVAGEMVRCNDELMLHVELINVEDGAQLWGAQFRRSYSVILSCPEKLADEIWHGLQVILASKRKRTAELPRKRVA